MNKATQNKRILEYIELNDSITPMMMPILNSFQTTFIQSSVSTSPVASPRMIRVAACDPVLPPVPISIGIYVTSCITLESDASNLVTIMPVNM